MSVYVIGDVQGCYKTLRRLLETIDFAPRRDRLLFAGDLVNRGPRSLEVLRWVREHDHCCEAVLGNHDVHLLAAAIGARKRRRLDTLKDILTAPDRDELIDWLRARPLLHEEEDVVLVHAGMHPRWSIKKARNLAGEVQDMLRGDNWVKRLTKCYEREPEDWDADLGNNRRLAAILSVFVTIRGCTKKGAMHREFSGPPKRMPGKYMAWFDVPQPAWEGRCVAFGHWARLGLRVTDRYIATDTGCVWGGMLSAVRLDDREVFQVPCAKSEYLRPGQD